MPVCFGRETACPRACVEAAAWGCRAHALARRAAGAARAAVRVEGPDPLETTAVTPAPQGP